MILLFNNENLQKNDSSQKTSNTTTGNLIDMDEYRTSAKQYNEYTSKATSKFSNVEFVTKENFKFFFDNYLHSSYNSSVEDNHHKGGQGMNDVNWQEKYLDNLDSNLKEINQNFTNTENRISEMINKHIEYSSHLDKQRHDEILNLNNKIDSSISEISANIESTNAKIEDTNKWIIGLVITTILGIVGIVIAALSTIL